MRRSREFGHTFFAQTDAFSLLTNCKIFANFVKHEDKLLWPNWQDIRLFGAFFGSGLALRIQPRIRLGLERLQASVTINTSFRVTDDTSL
jgi:hypothetical protein